jgi:hypothetical protein
MQNEFEKQVQQKMEELKLVPSEPVWQKVEMQIRKKKDRRRLIFWIPLLALLLGGGLWIGIDQYSNNVSYNRNNNEKLNHQIPKENSSVQPEQSVTKQTIKKLQGQNLETTLPPRPGKKTSSTITNESIRLSATSAFQKSKQRVKPPKENSFPEQQEKFSAKNNETVLTETQTKTREPVLQQDQVNKQTDQEQNFSDSNLTTVLPGQKNDSLARIEKVTLKVDSIKSDSIKQVRVKKYAASKWKLTFAVSGGVSGLGRLNVFNGFLIENKSMNYIPPVMSPGSGPGNGMIYHPPSEVKRDFSFAVHAGVKKQLTKRTSFSTGLGYNYYSKSMLVGNRVFASTLFGSYSGSQYFSNNNYGNASFHSYRNQYHFLSLPLALEWQLLKKHPLNLSTGFSLQYLLQTNGLIFDYNKQTYFHNKNAFNRLQLFSDLGLNYSFPVKKNSIAVGPQLQYGISRLEKGNSNHHLFMYSLKAQLQLK